MTAEPRGRVSEAGVPIFQLGLDQSEAGQHRRVLAVLKFLQG